MHWKSILVLAIVAGALGVVWHYHEEDVDGAVVQEHAVFTGVEESRVRAIAIDHRGRGLKVRLERDAEGEAWSLVEPLRFPADMAWVRAFLSAVRDNRGEELPQPDRAALRLDPAIAVVEVEELVGGKPRVTTMRLGAEDPLDPGSVFVEDGEGRVLRTARNLRNLLARTSLDYRSRRVIDLGPRESAIEVRREGHYPERTDDPHASVLLEAFLEEGRWRAAKPYRAALDPLAVQRLAGGVGQLLVEDFVDDAAASLADYGLDPPLFSIYIQTSTGDEHEVHFAHDQEADRWLCARPGEAFVFEVDDADARYAAQPLEYLLDYRILRSVRDRMIEVELENAAGQTRLVRDKRGWSLTQASEGLVLLDGVAADAGAVDDLLSGFERGELAVFLDEPFEPLEPPVRVRFRDELGGEWAGEFGQRLELEGGAGGHLFLREGDERAALVEDALFELAQTEGQGLRSLEVLRLSELDQFSVRLLGPGGEETFVRKRNEMRWSPEGVDLVAHDFEALVDRLLSIRAAEWLYDATEPLEEPIVVTLGSHEGRTRAYTVGRVAGEQGPRSAIEIDGERALLPDDLHAALAALLAGE